MLETRATRKSGLPTDLTTTFLRRAAENLTRKPTKKSVPERGVEPLCPFGQTGLSRPRIPFRHPGLGLMIN